MRVTSVDRFAIGLMEMLDETGKKVKANSKKAVKKGCIVARREVKENARSLGLRDVQGTTSRYIKGWGFRTTTSGDITTGEIGNSAVPGLVHLLEKGHARMGGGRVKAYPHVAPAADEAFIQYEKEMKRLIEEAMK